MLRVKKNALYYNREGFSMTAKKFPCYSLESSPSVPVNLVGFINGMMVLVLNC